MIRTRHLRQPPHAPQTLSALRLRLHTLPPLQRPDLSFPIVTSAEQVLAVPTPVKRHYPAPVNHEISDLLTRLGVVERYGPRIARRGERLARGTESNAAYRLAEARETMCETRSSVVEDVDTPVLVPGSGHGVIGGNIHARVDLCAAPPAEIVRVL